MQEDLVRGTRRRRGGGTGNRLYGFSTLAKNRSFHLRNGQIPRVIPPRMAESGVMRQDAARLRPVQFSKAFPIPLVKSDFEIGTESVHALPRRFSLCPLTVCRCAFPRESFLPNADTLLHSPAFPKPNSCLLPLCVVKYFLTMNSCKSMILPIINIRA